MFEIIRRKEGELSHKQEIRHDNVQVSYNDWGHLVVREWDKDASRIYPIVAGLNEIGDLEKGEEHIIVFDKDTSQRIINFLRHSNTIPF